MMRKEFRVLIQRFMSPIGSSTDIGECTCAVTEIQRRAAYADDAVRDSHRVTCESSVLVPRTSVNKVFVVSFNTGAVQEYSGLGFCARDRFGEERVGVVAG